ncbi:MAG: hypothetical protein K2P81_15075 [Bacteriovoracaceae bacterium]|nr:hypothetical protein [Bacteriovoracaceae bacterium]
MFHIFSSVAHSYPSTPELIVRSAPVLPRLSAADTRPLNVWWFHLKKSRLRRSDDKGVVYDTFVNLDDHGFRKNAFQNDEADHHVFFVGCSFTNGSGVQDKETFSSLVSEKFPHSNVVNMGKRGAGFSELYYLWKNMNFQEIYKKSKGVMIYTIIPSHLERFYLSWKYLDWAYRPTPVYSLKNRELSYEGILGDQPKYKIAQFINKFGLSYFWLRGVSHFDFEETSQNVKEYAFVISKLRDEYLKQFPEGKFVVTWFGYYHPTQSHDEDLKLALKENGIEYWDNQYPQEFIEKRGGYYSFVIPRDGHPSPATHKLQAEFLMRKLSENELLTQ